MYHEEIKSRVVQRISTKTGKPYYQLETFVVKDGKEYKLFKPQYLDQELISLDLLGITPILGA